MADAACPPRPPVFLVAQVAALHAMSKTDNDPNRSKQFISCTPCRSRKVKCPGERPSCSTCVKKHADCHYDAVRKRRGPDKEPGGRLKPRGTFINQFLAHSRSVDSLRSFGPTRGGRGTRTPPLARAAAAAGVVGVADPPARELWPRSSGRDRGNGNLGHLPPPLADGRSRRSSLTSGIVTHPNTRHQHPPTIAPEVLDSWWTLLFEHIPETQVVEHCQEFLEDSSTWFNFFHRGRFFQALFARAVGPHLIFAILAHTTFLRDGTSRTGQLRALHLAHEARRMLDACLDVGMQDATLVQTALLLVAFEFHPHIHQNLARAAAALGYMETCARVCAPVWREPPGNGGASGKASANGAGGGGGDAPARIIKQEELLRMCWALSQLAANSTIWRHLADQEALKLSTADPTQFSSLFPIAAEEERSDPGPVSMWARFHRSVCLWHVAVNHELDDAARTSVIYEARAIVRKLDATPAAGHPEACAGQAREWALAALAHLGDMDEAAIAAWFQAHAAMPFKTADTHATHKAPINTWRLLMVAFTGLRLLRQAPALLPEADPLLSRVFGTLDTLVSVWPCSTLEHNCLVLRRRYDAIKTEFV